MRLLIGRREGSSRRATPAAAPPPCRLHFLMFSALHAEKAALLRRKNAFGTPPTSLAPCRPESFLAAPKRPHEMQPPRFCAEFEMSEFQIHGGGEQQWSPKNAEKPAA